VDDDRLETLLAILLADDDDELDAALAYADGMEYDDDELLDAADSTTGANHARLLDALERCPG
jgi:hypothetical protein